MTQDWFRWWTLYFGGTYGSYQNPDVSPVVYSFYLGHYWARYVKQNLAQSWVTYLSTQIEWSYFSQTRIFSHNIDIGGLETVYSEVIHLKNFLLRIFYQMVSLPSSYIVPCASPENDILKLLNLNAMVATYKTLNWKIKIMNCQNPYVHRQLCICANV